MKILAHGNLTYKGSCPKCGCIFELPFEELTHKYNKGLRFEICPQCAYPTVLLEQSKSTPIEPPDADEPLCAREIYEFLSSFDGDSLVYVYLNKQKYTIEDMSDENGNLILSINQS